MRKGNKNVVSGTNIASHNLYVTDYTINGFNHFRSQSELFNKQNR